MALALNTLLHVAYASLSTSSILSLSESDVLTGLLQDSVGTLEGEAIQSCTVQWSDIFNVSTHWRKVKFASGAKLGLSSTNHKR